MKYGKYGPMIEIPLSKDVLLKEHLTTWPLTSNALSTEKVFG